MLSQERVPNPNPMLDEKPVPVGPEICHGFGKIVLINSPNFQIGMGKFLQLIWSNYIASQFFWGGTDPRRGIGRYR